MTTSTFLTVPQQTTDAEFRAWGQAVSTALAAVPTTGQIWPRGNQ